MFGNIKSDVSITLRFVGKIIAKRNNMENGVNFGAATNLSLIWFRKLMI